MANPSKSLPTLASEVAYAAPQVIAHRLTRMALAGANPSARDQREFYQMGAEKVEAFYESWNAMMLQSLQINQRLFFSFWFPWAAQGSSKNPVEQLEQAATQILTSALKPVHKRAVSNAKRLNKTGIL
ncbi:polyhydroxyalkanoate granule-associated phasin [uncultured Thiothrix sp.]|uniref:polyhydroxyalkanoate granule-associated phasin n=1 Tax=uncultured Thiothrix sp. TaxID=223185 RepID=UPI0026374994|nr:polyhydroxyalkanoate granule-associated phasin [uncultured Thiothrix sp.]HMT94006.1 hypothetical protein [Thiolinea sp.]